jgi:hypothetical protein
LWVSCFEISARREPSKTSTSEATHAKQLAENMSETKSDQEEAGQEKFNSGGPQDIPGGLSPVEVVELKVRDNVRAKVLDDAYAAKSQLVGEAMTLIGLNRWQYLMWSVCGFSWIVDNITNYSLSITFTSVAREWAIPDITLTSIAFSLGGLIGSLFW